MTQLIIAMPSGDQWQAKTGQALTNLVGWTVSQEPSLKVAMVNRMASMISGSRNDIVNLGLENGADWFLWIDSDMTFPPSTAIRLLAHDLPIVGATYNKRVYPYETLGSFKRPDDGSAPTSGMVEAYYLPAGIMLVNASVYKKIPYPWYYETYHPEGNPVDTFIQRFRDMAFTPPSPQLIFALRDQFAPWIEAEYAEKTRICGNARTMSEDYNFCRKARSLGYEIWCDLDLTHEVGHIGWQIVTTMPTGSTGSTPHFYQNIQGWFTGAAMHLYQRMVREAAEPAHFVEVGTWKGKSSAFMAVEIANSGKNIRFDTIDHFRGTLNESTHQADIAVRNGTLGKIARANLAGMQQFVNVIEGESAEVAKGYPDGSLDFVYLDAGHDAVAFTADLDAWLPKLRTGGTLAGDDFNWPEVHKTVTARFPNFQVDDTQWSVRLEGQDSGGNRTDWVKEAADHLGMLQEAADIIGVAREAAE